MRNLSLRLWAMAMIVIVCGVFITGCATTSAPTQPTTPPVTTTPFSFSTAELGLIQTGAGVATGAVLNFAVTNPTQRTTLANEMWEAGQALYSLTTGQIPTAATIQATVLSFGGTQVDANYASFATAISGLYSTYFSKLSGNGAAAIQLLSALAAGVENGASAYQTITATAAATTTP